MKKILVIGADGMLGSQLTGKLKQNPDYEVFETTIQTLDICSKDAVIERVKEINPYFIINCAAFTNVDACETNIELANSVNGYAVENIAEAANVVGATVLHISTDYVFDGNLPLDQAYTEDMEPNPVSAYGRSKLIGENGAKIAHKYYILRTAWLYGQGKNFVRTMLKLSQEKDELSVVNDQHGSPTSTTTLIGIIEQVLAKEPPYGIYHSTNEGFTTWYDFAKKIFEIKGINIKVNPVSSDAFPTPTKRPNNSKLSKEKLHSIGIFPKNYEDELKEYLKGGECLI